jgi:glycosyltransferase involved in cell wall biosynthesis
MVANLLINHKGHDIAFEVLSSAFWKEKDWHLNVYGSGVDELYIKKLCSFYGLDSRVTFHGKVNDIKSVWRRSHLLLMPSRLEGMPLAIVEAMLCARPVLATDVAGHMEWITDEVSGFIAEGANTYSLDKTLRRAWLQQEDWEKMGRNAYATALNLYDAEPGKTLAAIIMHSIDVQPDD